VQLNYPQLTLIFMWHTTVKNVVWHNRGDILCGTTFNMLNGTVQPTHCTVNNPITISSILYELYCSTVYKTYLVYNPQTP